METGRKPFKAEPDSYQSDRQTRLSSAKKGQRNRQSQSVIKMYFVVKTVNTSSCSSAGVKHAITLLSTSLSNNCFPSAFVHTASSPSQALNPVIKCLIWLRPTKCFSFWFPEPKPQPSEQHPGPWWENKHSGVHWHRMGQVQPSHVRLSALLCNSPLPWKWLPPGHVWSKRGQSSRLLHPHNHKTPLLMTRASGGEKKTEKQFVTQQFIYITYALTVGICYTKLGPQHERPMMNTTLIDSLKRRVIS